MNIINYENVNKTKVYDLFYDTDGCLIASSPSGIIKQLHPDFNSEFVNIKDFNENHEDILNNVDILKSRIGVEKRIGKKKLNRQRTMNGLI